MQNTEDLNQGWKTFSVKGKIVNNLDSVNHMVSVSGPQFSHCIVRAAIGNK